jgi:CspA family cold shock protein
MPQGKVKKVIAEKGFGFIEAQGGDLFFHHSELQGVAIEELREGQQVEYTVGQGKKGPCATAVRVVE